MRLVRLWWQSQGRLPDSRWLSLPQVFRHRFCATSNDALSTGHESTVGSGAFDCDNRREDHCLDDELIIASAANGVSRARNLNENGFVTSKRVIGRGDCQHLAAVWFAAKDTEVLMLL